MIATWPESVQAGQMVMRFLMISTHLGTLTKTINPTLING